MQTWELSSHPGRRMKDNKHWTMEITTVICLPCLMSEDVLPLYCVHDVLLLWQHGDMTGIPLQVVHSYKCFNGKVNSCLKARFSMQNNPTKMEKYKRLSCWYCHIVVPLTDCRNSLMIDSQFFSTIVLWLSVLALSNPDVNYLCCISGM